MARTPQWVKKLGGHAGELFVCAELSRRGIPNAMLPENFSDDDVLVGDKACTQLGFVQVKACHPDRSASFILREQNETWVGLHPNTFCVFVWLGKVATNEPPRYWIARKSEVGQLCITHPAHGTENWERRFFADPVTNTIQLPPEWKDRWSLFDHLRPDAGTVPPSISDPVM